MFCCLIAGTTRALVCMANGWGGCGLSWAEHCHLFPSGWKVVGVSLVVSWVLEPPLAVLLGLEDGLHLRVAGRPNHLLFDLLRWFCVLLHWDRSFWSDFLFHFLTMGQPLLALTLQRQVPGRVDTREPSFSHWCDLNRKAELDSCVSGCWGEHLNP